MEMLGHLMVVIETFEEINFFVAVQIVQDRQLIAASEMNFSVDDFSTRAADRARLRCVAT